MALRKEKLENFKRELTTRRDNLALDLRNATVQLIEDDEVYNDTIDQASAITDKTMALQMKTRDREILIQVEEALRRIEAGLFGECEKCGDEIAEGRIKAFPLATLCIDCQAELESEEHRFPGRTLSHGFLTHG